MNSDFTTPPDAASSTSPSFATDIQPLFRDKDRNAMINSFDLWDYADVKSNADDIYFVVSKGKMPCDGSWPSEKVTTFKAWMDADYPV